MANIGSLWWLFCEFRETIDFDGVVVVGWEKVVSCEICALRQRSLHFTAREEGNGCVADTVRESDRRMSSLNQRRKSKTQTYTHIARCALRGGRGDRVSNDLGALTAGYLASLRPPGEREARLCLQDCRNPRTSAVQSKNKNWSSELLPRSNVHKQSLPLPAVFLFSFVEQCVTVQGFSPSPSQYIFLTNQSISIACFRRFTNVASISLF